MNLNIFRLWSISFLKKIALWKMFLLAHREWTVGCLCISYINLKSTLRVCVHLQFFFSFFPLSFFFLPLFCAKSTYGVFYSHLRAIIEHVFLLFYRTAFFSVVSQSTGFYSNFMFSPPLLLMVLVSCLVCIWLVKGEVTLTSAMLTQKLNCLQFQALPVECKKDI